MHSKNLKNTNWGLWKRNTSNESFWLIRSKLQEPLTWTLCIQISRGIIWLLCKNLQKLKFARFSYILAQICSQCIPTTAAQRKKDGVQLFVCGKKFSNERKQVEEKQKQNTASQCLYALKELKNETLVLDNFMAWSAAILLLAATFMKILAFPHFLLEWPINI